MSKFEIETSTKEKPIILLYGDDQLFKTLAEALVDKLKIAYVAQDNELLAQNGNIYHINKSSSHLLNSLEEKFDYAVIVAENLDKKYLPHLFEKIEKDKTKTAILIDIFQASHYFDLINRFKELPFVNFLFVGSIYSERGYYKDSEITKIIEKAKLNKSLTLTGNDLSPLFPIYIKDAADGVCQVLFGPKKKINYYYLFYSHPQTLISTIHILKRAEYDLEIKYDDKQNESKSTSGDEIQQEIKSKTEVEPSYLDRYFIGFEKSLEFFNKEEAHENTSPVKERGRLAVLPQKILKTERFGFFRQAFLTSLVLFVILNLFFIGAFVVKAQASLNSLKKNDYQETLSNIKAAKLLYDLTEPVILPIVKLTSVLKVGTVEAAFDEAQSGISLMFLVSDNFETITKYREGLDRESLDRLIADTAYIYFRVEEQKQKYEGGAIKNLEIESLSKFASLAQIAPQFLGYDSEKNYLILFQNNGELRPTGGFIGSVGEVKIRGGKIEDFKIQDVYEYDGQLKAHVEPHYIIRRYLQPHLYLRDSNFDPDFQESARQAALIYRLETDREVDGIIAVNFEAVRQLIGIMGPINLPSYNKTIDQNNAFEFLQETIDDNFFPGSSAKRDILSSLSNQLFLKFETDKISFLKVASLIPALTHGKHILFAIQDNSVQSAFSANGFGGDLNDLRIAEESKINDFVSVNEANIGVNKANINVLRETTYEATLSEENLNSKIIHTVFNGGIDTYHAYIRALVPLGGSLLSIKINGEEQVTTQAIIDPSIYERDGFRPPDELEVDEFEHGKWQSFGFIIEVGSEEKQTIEILYENALRIPETDIINYSLLFLKQPGTLDYPFTLKLNTGNIYSPKEVENVKLENNSIIATSKVDSDKIFEMELIKR